MIDRHSRQRYQVLRPFVFVAGLATLGGCGFPVNDRGNLPKADLLAQIKPGVTDKNSVKSLLGTPSSVAAFDGDTWYYISKEERQIAFLKPQVLNQQVYVIHFDNRGEGGILALMGLVSMNKSRRTRLRVAFIILGVFGAALLYGDGMITPAISVLSAVEGLNVATPFFTPYIIPITIIILVLLFMLQRRGTTGIGQVFGPIMLLWFATIAVLGIRGIVMDPSVLAAINPIHAVRFFFANRLHGFLVLGAVFLVTTGGEALYADLGHFGPRPIKRAWFIMAGPALVIQYLGQGALLLHQPAAAHNPFYLLAPPWALYPLVVLATSAAIIGSQAIISGVF